MAGSSIFGRSDDDGSVDPDGFNDPGEPPRGVGKAEGVRVIDASEAAHAVEQGTAAKRKRDDEPRLGDRPEVPPVALKPTIRFPLADGDDAAAIDRPRPMTSTPPNPPRLSSVSDATGQHPVISLGPPTAEVELPHWSATAAGEVPRVILGDNADDDDQAWTSYAASGPRWRDQDADWDEASIAELAADLGDDEGINVGAMSGIVPDEASLTHDEFLGFDDLEMPDAPPPEADLSKVSARGTAADPIRIGSADLGVAARPSGASQPFPRTGALAGRSTPSAAEREANQGSGAEPNDGEGRDIRTAALYGGGIALAAAICFVLGNFATTVFVAAILFLSAGEFFGAVRKKGFAPLVPLGLAAVVALPFAALSKGEAGIPLVLFLTIVVSAVWYIAGVAEEHPLANIGITMLGVVYIGVLGSFAVLFMKFPLGIAGLPADAPHQGISLLLLAVIATVGYDLAGFTIGRKVGKRPLSKVSPNKTIEGLLAGCGVSILSVLAFGSVFGPLKGTNLLIFAAACAAIAPIGDLTESLMKRDLGIKDFSNMIPGHGGVLDRFDGLFFVLPTAYYVARALLDVT